jgi:beta-phosphoglucomutase
MDSIKAVIFDLDQTLIDSHKSHALAFKSVLARHGVDVEDEHIAKKFGKTGLEIISEILREKAADGFDAEDIAKMAKEKSNEYRKHCDIGLMPGAMRLIKRLHGKGIRMAVATASSRENLEMAMEKTGIGGYFEVFITAADIGHGKPDPEILRKAAEKLGVKAGECVSIDDSLLGIRAAVSAGMKSVAVATGEWPIADLKKEASVAFLNLNEMLDGIDEILEL